MDSDDVYNYERVQDCIDACIDLMCDSGLTRAECFDVAQALYHATKQHLEDAMGNIAIFPTLDRVD